MTVERLFEKDVDQIISLYQTDFKDGWNKNMLLSAFSGGRFYALGVKDDAVLVGVITFSKGYDDADIEGVVVKTSHRGKGIAKKLIESAEQLLASLKNKKILLEVREGNLPARSLYKSAGFNDIAVRKNYYADGENAVIMVKEQ